MSASTIFSKSFMDEVLGRFGDDPDRVFYEAANRRYTGGYMLEKSALVRDALAESGVRKGDRCAFSSSDNVGAMVAIFGIMRAGGIVVGLPNFQSSNMWSYFLADSEPSAVVSEDCLCDRVRGAMEAASVRAPLIRMDDQGSLVDDPPRRSFDDAPIREGDPVAIRYTSGSTGDPKGVVLSNRYMVGSLKCFSIALGCRDGGRFLMLTPPTEAIGYIQGIVAPCRGEVTVIYSGKPTSEGILMAIEESEVTDTFLPTTQMVKLADSPAVEFADLSSLDRMLYAGQSFFPDAIDRARRKLGCGLSQVYGQTETGPVAWLSPEDHETGDLSIIATAGRPMPLDEISIEVRDQGTGETLEVGGRGHIFVKSPYGAKEIWNQRLPDEPDGGWWDTEDIGSFDEDGRLSVKGRDRDVIFFRGFTIFCRDVEECLMGFPGIREAAVHPVTDPVDGEHVFAWVVPETPSHRVDISALGGRVEEELGAWYRPSRIEVIEEMPTKSALAKFDKALLRDRAEALVSAE